MATKFGMAQLSSSDYAFTRINTLDKALLYEATTDYLMMANMNMRAAAGLFVEGQTSRYSERYQLPMGGRMQRRSGQTKSGSVKRSGSWDVGYPLYDFGDEVAMTDIDFAYMTGQEFRAHIDGVVIRAVNTYRHEVLRRIFKNTNDTFTDPYNGSVTVKPLANSDSDVYPPVNGSDSEATAQHYLESGYAATAISDTNNPFSTMEDLLVTRFGRMTGGIPIVTLINKAERPETEALTKFEKVVPNAIIPGSNTNQVRPVNAPGETIGYVGSTWVNVWDWIPANYMVSIYLDAPAPLKERVDPPDTGLASGLQLVNQDTDYPILFNDWRFRFGIGTGNRVNGVVMELGTGGSYSIPAAYS